MDNFYEQLLPTKKTSIYKAFNVFVYVFGVVAFLTLAVALIIPCVVSIAISVGSFFYKKRLYVEYEYEFTNGTIEIDAIYEMKKRKKMITFEVKDIELMALADSDYVKDFSNTPQRTESYYTNGSQEKLYAAMITGGNERLELLFTPDDRFVELCFKYNPRAVKKNVGHFS